MGLIKVDPSQKTAAVALIGVLVVVVGVTVVRVRPQNAPTAKAVVQTARGGEDKKPLDTEYHWRTGSNPFKKPAWAVEGEPAGAEAPAVRTEAVPNTVQTIPWLPPGSSGMSVVGRADGPTRPGPLVSPGAKLPAPAPSFILLATTIGPNGRCAVVQTGDSTAKVVSVGDILEGGYRVKELSVDRVVLTNGRDTIIGKKTDAHTSENSPVGAKDGR